MYAWESVYEGMNTFKSFLVESERNQCTSSVRLRVYVGRDVDYTIIVFIMMNYRRKADSSFALKIWIKFNDRWGETIAPFLSIPTRHPRRQFSTLHHPPITPTSSGYVEILLLWLYSNLNDIFWTFVLIPQWSRNLNNETKL
jgi:hypothetical protein